MHSQEQILMGALDLFAQRGIAAVGTDDIAVSAGVNRTTLYRRLGTKKDIVDAAIVFETGRVIANIEESLPEIPDGHNPDFDANAYLVAFFAVTHAELRANPLLQRLLRHDHVATIHGITVGAGPVLNTATAILADRLRAVRRAAGLSDDFPVDAVAATISRLQHSLLLNQSGPPILDTRAQREHFAETVVIPLVLR